MLVLLAAVVTGAWATTVTWVTTDFYNTSPDTFTKYDVTVTTTNQARMSNYFYGNGVNTFTTTLGNFTKIEIVFMPESSPVSATGWNYEVIESVQPFPDDMPEIVEYTSKLTWTGDAESVSIQGLVMNIKSITFTIAEPATNYTVTLKEGTEDATSWTITPAEATTTGVAAGTEVKATYGGVKKVKSVKAKKKAMAPAEGKTYTNLQGGEVLHVGDKITETEGKFRYTHHSNPQSTDYYTYIRSFNTYEVLRADVVKDGYNYKYTESPDGQYYVLKHTYYDDDEEEWFTAYYFNQDLPVTGTSDGITVTLDGQDGSQRNLYTFWVHEPNQ